MNKQFWLVELDRYGTPRLVDGAHPKRDGAEKAMTLLRRLNLSKDGVKYAVAEITVHVLTGKHSPVNEEAMSTISTIMENVNYGNRN